MDIVDRLGQFNIACTWPRLLCACQDTHHVCLRIALQTSVEAYGAPPILAHGPQPDLLNDETCDDKVSEGKVGAE